MNRPELYGIELIPALVEDEELGERASFNSPKAENEKKFEFAEEEEGDERQDSFSSVNID
jgi:hypothetical protein